MAVRLQHRSDVRHRHFVQYFNPGKGIWARIGRDSNTSSMFLLKDTQEVFINTLVIASMKIVANLIAPLLFALMLNELRLMILRRWIQTIAHLPHFLSWVILGALYLICSPITDPSIN